MIPHVNPSKDEFEDVDLQDALEKTRRVKWHHQILLNRPLKVVLVLIIAAVLAPLLIYEYVYYTGTDLVSPDGFSLGSCLVPRTSRLLCGKGNVTAAECHRQCCYDLSNNTCFHRFPSRFSYIMDRQWAEDVNLKPRIATIPFKTQNSLTNMRLSLDEISSTHLGITFYNATTLNFTGLRMDATEYEYVIESPELNLVVNSTQGTIFNTVRGPLIASENIWEIAFKLTEDTMYGFGEIPIQKDSVKVIYNRRGGPSSIPLVYARYNGSYHGLLIDTVDPTEVTFREDNVIVIRSITNFGLKFHLFVGPKPADVMKDVIKFVGFKNNVEYWMLGAHVCSEYSNVTQVTDINDYVQEASTRNMPFESHCVKPIVFDHVCDTAAVTQVNDGAKSLRTAGKKFIPHVSPHILYEILETNLTESHGTNTDNTKKSREITSNCSYNIEDYAESMLQNANRTGMYQGIIDNEHVVFPDYGNDENMTAELMEHLWIYTTDIDGVILQNNWPLDESQKWVNETKLWLPYFSENFEEAFNHTPSWNATKVNGKKYLFEHNKYGQSFTKAFINLTSNIGVSSQWMDGDVYVNRQNIDTSWTNLRKELVEAALGGIAGHWQWSTPICGDTDNFDSDIHIELCVKWYLAATYMPMVRVHSKDSPRDPLFFNGTYRSLMIEALRNRLMLAPYFFTTLQEGPLLRPMFYQFPESEALKDLSNQFSVGNDLVMIPNLQPNQSMVHVVMPPGVWYEMWSGLKMDAEEGETFTLATTESDLLTLIRGGSIINIQKDVKLTAETTQSESNTTLIIALECKNITANLTREIEENSTLSCAASGSFFVASNTTIHFEADGEKLHITVEGEVNVFCTGSTSFMFRYIQQLNVYGLSDEFNNFDNMRQVDTSTDLCTLQLNPVIELALV